MLLEKKPDLMTTCGVSIKNGAQLFLRNEGFKVLREFLFMNSIYIDTHKLNKSLAEVR